MEELIYGKYALGGYYVRPVSWAGIWNGTELVSGNILYNGSTENDCIGFINSEKLRELNTIEVDDYDWDSDGIIYVAITNSEENVQKLKELGATEMDIEEMYMDDCGEELDIASFAFSSLQADFYKRGKGFYIEKHIAMPDGKGGVWHLTSDDCVFRCEKCGREAKVKIGYDNKYIEKEKCCDQDMKFRYWTDRSDIYYEEIVRFVD